MHNYLAEISTFSYYICGNDENLAKDEEDDAANAQEGHPQDGNF